MLEKDLPKVWLKSSKRKMPVKRLPWFGIMVVYEIWHSDRLLRLVLIRTCLCNCMTDGNLTRLISADRHYLYIIGLL